MSEVAVDRQEPVVLRRYAAYPLPALTDIGPAAAASKHTTAPINHIRPSPRKRSPDSATPSEVADIRLLLTTHLSRPSAGQLKHAGQGPTLYHWTAQPTKGVGDGSGRLISGWLSVVWVWSTHAMVSASLLPTAGSMQAGL